MNDNLHEQHNQQPQHENTDNISSPDSKENKKKEISPIVKLKQDIDVLFVTYKISTIKAGYNYYKKLLENQNGIKNKKEEKELKEKQQQLKNTIREAMKTLKLTNKDLLEVLPKPRIKKE